MNPDNLRTELPENPSCTSGNSESPAGHPATSCAAAGVKAAVMCAGMFSSGSTWAFNVVMQLLCKAHPNARVVPQCTDDFGAEQETAALGADWLVFKTHRPSPAMRLFSRLGQFPIVLSIRDPRDAAASLMQRFSVSFERAFDMVVACSNALARLTDLPHILLRYEDAITDREESIAEIAQHLGMELPARDRQRIFASLAPDAVMATITELQARDAIIGTEPADAFDPHTHWHPGHVGDRRVGKWMEYLTPAQSARVRYATREFCNAFGYTDVDTQLPTGEPVHFSTEGTGVNYLVRGFSHQEGWGIWTAADCAVMRARLKAPAKESLTIELQCWLGPTLRRTSSNTSASILLNGHEMLRITADDRNPADLLLCLAVKGALLIHGDVLEIRFEFDSLLSPAELGDGSDTRLLGLGLLKLKVSSAK